MPNWPAPGIRRLRDPTGVIHVNWIFAPMDVTTVCEHYDNQVYWPEKHLAPTEETPTCIRCVILSGVAS